MTGQRVGTTTWTRRKFLAATLASGAAVANATVAGQVVTFTLTPFVDDHVDVHGTAWFTVKFADSVEPGPGLVLEFIASGTVFRDTINVTGVVPHDYSTSGTKWQTWANPDVSSGSGVGVAGAVAV